jgi:hypothetical protein
VQSRVMDFVLDFMNFDGYLSESIHVVPPFYATLTTATMEMYQTFKRQGSSVDPTRCFMNNINTLFTYLSANHSILMDKMTIFIPINGKGLTTPLLAVELAVEYFV